MSTFSSDLEHDMENMLTRGQLCVGKKPVIQSTVCVYLIEVEGMSTVSSDLKHARTHAHTHTQRIQRKVPFELAKSIMKSVICLEGKRMTCLPWQETRGGAVGWSSVRD